VAELAAAAAAVLAVVFAWAAVAKLRRRTATERSFRDLSLPAPAVLARLVPAAELAVAIGLVAGPAVASWAALVLLLAFSVVVVRAVARGDAVPCACFGSSAGGDAVSTADLLRNAGFGALALVATYAAPGAIDAPAFVPAAAVLLATASGAALVAVYRRRLAAVRTRAR
jgi:uncharacterized membrane protein YphA (DoxX/SURF4 family)